MTPCPRTQARLSICFEHLEAKWPGSHDAFLRLRPDSLVLGPLPTPLLPIPALFGHVYHSRSSKLLHRDQIHCGQCENFCKCEQNKWGQILWHARADHCAVLTDQVFLFPAMLLPPVRWVLGNYSSSATNEFGHFARQRIVAGGPFCLDAGRMAEIGWSRLLEFTGIPVAPLSFRSVLSRMLQPNTSRRHSVECMLTWGSSAPSCTDRCVPFGYMRDHANEPIAERIKARGLERAFEASALAARLGKPRLGSTTRSTADHFYDCNEA